jgi:hypothetical protein
MKKRITLLVLIISSFAMAQESPKWTIGFGVNAIENSADKEAVYFVPKNLNILPVMSKLTVSYDVKKYFTVGTEIAINKYTTDKLHNGEYTLLEDASFIAIDINAKYNVDHFFTKAKWFDASVVGGVGYFWLGTETNQSINPGLALDFWLGDGYGFRLQSLGRFAFDNFKLNNNHIQHSVEFIIKF